MTRDLFSRHSWFLSSGMVGMEHGQSEGRKKGAEKSSLTRAASKFSGIHFSALIS
jgi:hypothetical protein